MESLKESEGVGEGSAERDVEGPGRLESEGVGLESDVGVGLPIAEDVQSCSLGLGVLDGRSFFEKCWEIFEEVCYWNVKCMRIPNGAAGKAFVSELSELFRSFGERVEPVGLVASFIMPKLMLQSPPFANGKAKKELLENRLKKWKDGDLNSLMDEGRLIQRLQSRRRTSGKGNRSGSMARSFANLMFEGKIEAIGVWV